MAKARPKSRSFLDYIGKSVFVRTVTSNYTGRLVGISEGFMLLDDAAWIADSGRFAAALAVGTLEEIEPYPGACAVSVLAITDVSEWKHDLPRATK